MKKCLLLLGVVYLPSGIAAESAQHDKHHKGDKYEGEEMVITSTVTDRKFPNTAKATPTYTIDKADVDTKVNATTVEDVIRYAPSLHMRRRYIGDQNAMIGIRGTNILQTAHNMVFGDGMPLHSPVNVSFAGVPRWQKFYTAHFRRNTVAVRWAASSI